MKHLQKLLLTCVIVIAFPVFANNTNFIFSVPNGTALPEHADIIGRDHRNTYIRGTETDATRLALEKIPVTAIAESTTIDTTGYHTVDSMAADLNTLDQSAFASLRIIGQSVENRPIFALKVSENPDTDDTQNPAIIVLGLVHAREWIGMETVYRLANYFATTPDGQSQVEGITLWFIPIVNPDGLVHSQTTDRFWRKNRRDNGDGTFGVDLNRNYNVDFSEGSTDSSGETFAGPYPFSEPETAAVRTLIDSPNVKGIVDFHSYSQFIMYPWAYTKEDTPDDAVFDALAKNLSNIVKSVHGEFYDVGQPPDLLSYFSSGTSTDYTYHTHGILSLAVELRPQNTDNLIDDFIYPASDLDSVSEEWIPAMSRIVSVVKGNEFPSQIDLSTPFMGCGSLPWRRPVHKVRFK